MATMAEISAAINQIDVKKQNLHQSFLHLQSHLPSSFNFPLNWADLDSYFTSLHSSLHSKFNLLQTLPPPARPELKSFCQNSDGLGLVQFIALSTDHQSILSELVDAYKYAPDAPAMVLDAMVAFYSPDWNWKEEDLVFFRSSCLVMLKGLVELKPVIRIELKDRAMEMAMQWNQMRIARPGDQRALGFVLLVGAYGLIDRFSVDDITDCFLVATYGETIDLCRRILPANSINYMIQKLIDKNRIETAIKFSIGLKKTDEFPLVGLLERLKLRSMSVMDERRRNAENLDAWKSVTMMGIKTLESIIKCIDENHLESEYPNDSLVELVNKLENEMKNPEHVKGLLRKQPLSATVMQQQLLSNSKPKVNKVQPTAESVAVTHVLDQPELKSFCENSDGLGLMRFIAHASDHQSILSELPDAYQCAPDAPAMVLDAMAAFYSSGFKDTELFLFRSACLIMLEALIHVKLDITIELKDKALEMAVQWNQKRGFCPCEQKALAFLLLVGAYGLIDRFSIDDITDCFLIVATEHHTIDLCRQIIPANNINYMIQKLVDNGMIVTAVKCSIELQKIDEFPPVGLLEELKLRSMRVMEEKRKKAKYIFIWNVVTREEICTLNSIIKCIDENHLESEYPKDHVIELVNKLEDEIKNSKHGKRLLKKRPPIETRRQLLSDLKMPKKSKKPKPNKVQPSAKSAAVTHSESKMLKKSKKLKLNNVKPTAESAAATPVQSDRSIQESHSQKSNLSPDHVGECHKSPLGSGPNGSGAPYVSPIASTHGSTGADTGYNFFVQQLKPPADCNSNGWISD